MLCFCRVVETFYFLVTLQIVLGIYALGEGVRWLLLARESVRQHPGFFAPRVALICPCKGLEPGLEQNLSALVDFDYVNYEVFFTLASSADPAHDVLRRVAGRSRHAAHIVVAGKAEGRSEKVNNLLAAIEQVPDDFEVYVFADSDGRPPRHWLQHLVAPLADARIGAATTYRWYLPEHGSFWSALAAAWNASVATLLGDHARNFCWGGGTAIRREVFHQAGVREFWRGSASDDFSLTRALAHDRRRIRFVPECLVPTLHDTDFSGVMRFTNRQLVLSRVYAPRVWALAALSHLLYCGALVLGSAALLTESLAGRTALHIFLLTLVVPLLAVAKGYLRMVAVTELLPAWREKLMAYGWVWTFLAALVPFLVLVNAGVSVSTRRIVWRGIHYELISPTQTRILSR